MPYHWLLATVGNAGYLKYQDTSTGQLVVEHRTKLGACTTMTQNQHNAVIHLGHQNGTVTLWTPNLPHPAVRLLAHLGPVASVAVDASTGGRYMATSGQDGAVKVWDCRNWKGAVRQWNARGGPAELDWSQRGALAVATGGSVNVSVRVLARLRRADGILGLRETCDTNALRWYGLPAAIHDPPCPTTPYYLRPLLSVPGYPDNRAQCWSIKHPRTRCRRAELR